MCQKQTPLDWVTYDTKHWPLQRGQLAGGADRSPGMSRSKSHGHLSQQQAESPSKLDELEPDTPGKSFSSRGSNPDPDPASLTVQEQVLSLFCSGFADAVLSQSLLASFQHVILRQALLQKSWVLA